jgi:hypothetical protein
MRLAVLVAAGLLAGTSAFGSSVHGTRAAPRPVTGSASGCCTDPDVQNYGYNIDFSAWPDGEELTDQLRGAGLLFGKAVSVSAPSTMVLSDPSRAYDCQYVLNGEPAFDGWEYFIFVDPTGTRWSKVQKVGVDVGYCDREQTTFLAAYDAQGNLLQFAYNDRIGFQFLKIERPTADIFRVVVGDCNGPFCYQDGGGSAMNCLTYSGPVATTQPLPADMPMPPPPRIQGVPGYGPAGLMTLLAGMMALSVLALLRRPAAARQKSE